MKHETTHPWISFNLDMTKASPNFWTLLGEAKSKCQHLAGVPLKPKTAEYLHLIYLARGALATTAIEGNTLSEREAVKVVKGNSKLPESQQYLAKEIQNVLTAANTIMKEIETDGEVKNLKAEDIKRYNKYILDGLDVAGHVVPGEYRKCGIEVASYIAPKWEEVPSLIGDLCAWLNGEFFKRTSDDTLINAIIKAIVGHIYIAWIHPFGDGNGRTSRMLEFRFLVEGGVPSDAAHLLSNHYNKTRSEYYRRLEDASKNGGDVLPFLEYAIKGFVDLLHEQLSYVKIQQWSVSWQDYVHEVLGPNKNASIQRQLHLVFALSDKRKPCSKSEILELTPEIARLYARKTNKTLSRDINKLCRLGLIHLAGGKVAANPERILSFLPRAKKEVINDQLEELEKVFKEI